MDKKAVGRRIKEARKKRNLTQEELAELTDLSSNHISVIERGVKVPRLDAFVAIANALGVSADTLLVDVVENVCAGATDEVSQQLAALPSESRRRVLQVLQALLAE